MWKKFFFENMTIINCFSFDNLFFLQKTKIRMFFSKNAICCEDVNNVFLCLVSKYEMWSKNAISDFFFCKKYFCEFVFVIMFNHLIVYVSIVRLEVFRDDERDLIRFFEMTRTWRNDSSNSTKMTYQIWRKRFIKLDTSDLIKLD